MMCATYVVQVRSVSGACPGHARSEAVQGAWPLTSSLQLLALGTPVPHMQRAQEHLSTRGLVAGDGCAALTGRHRPALGVGEARAGSGPYCGLHRPLQAWGSTEQWPVAGAGESSRCGPRLSSEVMRLSGTRH